jgi:hypothetical protein
MNIIVTKTITCIYKCNINLAYHIGGLIQQGSSVAILDSSFYAIKWYHDFYFENNLCSNKLLSLILEGGKRLSKPVCKKDPITPDI